MNAILLQMDVGAVARPRATPIVATFQRRVSAASTYGRCAHSGAQHHNTLPGMQREPSSRCAGYHMAFSGTAAQK